MREILFRGKRTDNGKWVEGLLARYNPKYDIVNMVIYFDILVPVYTRMVGQFTGLTDKNGKKIFEGDILKSESDGYIGVVKYNEIIASFVSEINDTTPEFYHYSLLNKGDVSKTTQLKETVVIGNIHDNPELLRGADADE